METFDYVVGESLPYSRLRTLRVGPAGQVGCSELDMARAMIAELSQRPTNEAYEALEMENRRLRGLLDRVECHVDLGEKQMREHFPLNALRYSV